MKKKIFKSLLVYIILLMTFFSFKLNSYALYINYNDFSWEEFLEKYKGYWSTSCNENDSECYDRLLLKQEKFFKRLYKLLVKYQNKGYHLDDKVVVATVFYGLTPSSFRDPIENEYNPFKLEDEDASSFIAEISDIFAAKSYFEQETDTLNVLMNSMIGYTQVCYGVNSDTPYTNDNSELVCSGNGIPFENKCVEKVDTFELSLFEILFGGFKFFSGENENEKKCKELSSSYSGSFLGEVSAKPEYNLDLYWKFLENSDYFDKKDHLQSYFSYVLSMTNHKKMTELGPEEYEKHDKYIKESRSMIIKGIQDVVKLYEDDFSNSELINGSSATYWWPIGSVDTTQSDGKLMAVGEPEFTNVTSKYGMRIHPITKEKSKHNGIDISGNEGTTNVIAVRDGTVVSIIDDSGGNCVVGDQSCGGTYGNFVIIQHSDNNYSLYAHMYTGSLTVKSGDVVKKGQVIGKVGNTGRSKGGHLHFEIRVGGNEYSAGQDPLVYVSPDNPRGGVGDIVIPVEYGNSGFFSYTKIDGTNWKYNQKKVYDIWKQNGSKNENYIAVIDGRYLIACTSTYGNIGDYIDFYLEDGTVIPAIMMDEKSQKSVPWDRNPANEWGHDGGQQIIEFEITFAPNKTGNVGSWTGWDAKRVASATNLGKNIIQN